MTPNKEEAVIPLRPEWLDQRREAPFRPELPVIDAHHHLWTRDGMPYLLPEFLRDAASGHRVTATVYMECHAHYRAGGPEHLRPVGEVEYAAGLAAHCAREGGPLVCAGIVGHTDLRQVRQAEEVLEAMVEAGDGRFRGIRQISVWHPDPRVKGTIMKPPPGLLFDPEFRRGAGLLAARNLSFDAWALHHQLVDIYDLACLLPDLTIIMNHAGGAIGMGLYEGRRDLAFAEWRAAIRTLAQAPNVFAKLGGFGMRLWGFAFDQQAIPPSSEDLAAAVRPYVESCIEAFGPERCMFESNFPVDKGSFHYVTYWNAMKRIVQDYTETEQSMLFSGTARRAYRLEV